MNQFLNYAIEYLLLSFIFWMLYQLFFSKKTDFRFQRFYIISSCLLCLCIPLLPVPRAEFIQEFGILLSPIQIGGTDSLANEVQRSSLSITQMFLVLYAIGVIYFGTKLLVGLGQIFHIQRTGKKMLVGDTKVILHPNVHASYSFLGNVFLPIDINTESNDTQLIIDHENQHIQLGHSFEKLLLLINRVFFWWLPFSHIMLRNLELVHEYEVDQQIAKKVSTYNYGQFLIEQIESKSKFEFVNNISSHIKKRIIMLSHQKVNISKQFKWISYIGLIGICLIVHACQPQEDPVADIEELKAENKIQIDDTQDTYTETVTDTIMTFDMETKEESLKIVSYEDVIYSTPDKMPLFGECVGLNNEEEQKNCSNQNLLQFIYKNLTYPAEAKDNAVEGIAVAQFVIGSNGNVRSESILRSIGHGTDEAILSIFDKMRKENVSWTPGKNKGKNVSVKYTLPVKFKLQD